MKGKTVIVTGGNSGIGKETVVGLAELGAHVVLASRSTDKGAAAVTEVKERVGDEASVECLQLDLASFASIRAFSAAVHERFDAVHVLVNNAGLVLSDRRETEEGFEMTFGVNHLGHFLLTDLLLDLLEAGAPSRVINVSSDAHRAAMRGLDFDDLQARQKYSGFKRYGQSKLANILYTNALAPRVADRGISAFSMHPGMIKSGFSLDGDMRGVVPMFYKVFGWAIKKPKSGAKTTVYLATAEGIEDKTGGYFANRKPKGTSKAARDEAASERLWQVSEELVASVG